MSYGRKFNPCGRCGSIHLKVVRSNDKYICSCKSCGKKSPEMPTIWEAYRAWQVRL